VAARIWPVTFCPRSPQRRCSSSAGRIMRCLH
jgi:hypothetical protein